MPLLHNEIRIYNMCVANFVLLIADRASIFSHKDVHQMQQLPTLDEESEQEAPAPPPSIGFAAQHCAGRMDDGVCHAINGTLTTKGDAPLRGEGRIGRQVV